MTSHVMPTYNRLPITFARGQGAWLFDTNGERYLDAISGIAVCGLGHAHPGITQAIQRQAENLLHTSNLYGIEHQEALATRLAEISGLDNVFFCNSGAEANEAALKIARRHGHHRGLEDPAVVVMQNSFHGRTLATLSATGNSKIQQGFQPLLEGFIRAPFDDIEAVRSLAKQHANIAALLVEPVQGEGGVRVPAFDYLKELRQLCDVNGWLLMLDEVQTGVGRTGRYFAFQHADILPDVCTLAKALGNGVPIGACLASGDAATTLTAGSHGSTFGGNPLACASALAVLQAIDEEHLVERAAHLGKYFHTTLRSRLEQNSHVTDIRGRGLMLGIELDKPCAELVKLALDKQILINVTAENTVRLLPPLILSDKEAQHLVETLVSLVNNYTQTPAE